MKSEKELKARIDELYDALERAIAIAESYNKRDGRLDELEDVLYRRKR